MDTIAWLTTLIGFDTTSRHSNLGLIEHVRDALLAQGLRPWLALNAEQTKANLFVTVPAANGSEQGGLVLSGHTDVVPVDGQDWHSDPFQASIRDGRLYGRGSCDMKGFLAACLNVVPLALATPLKQPLHLAFSYDEEIGCLGAPLMLDEIRRRGLSPQHCIVGEPTGMRMVVAHKGINAFRCRVHGHSAHSSLTPYGVNAIEYAAKLIVFINGLAAQLQQRPDLDAAFDVPFATLSTGVIRGGTATNIVPNLCEFRFDYRQLPHMGVAEVLEPLRRYIEQELLPQMQAVAPESAIELTQTETVPPLSEAEAHALHDLVSTLVDDAARYKVAYATEGGQFQAAGIPTIICGPGDIRQAHKPNEFVALSQLARCDRFLQQLLAQMQQTPAAADGHHDGIQ